MSALHRWCSVLARLIGKAFSEEVCVGNLDIGFVFSRLTNSLFGYDFVWNHDPADHCVYVGIVTTRGRKAFLRCLRTY